MRMTRKQAVVFFCVLICGGLIASTITGSREFAWGGCLAALVVEWLWIVGHVFRRLDTIISRLDEIEKRVAAPE